MTQTKPVRSLIAVMAVLVLASVSGYAKNSTTIALASPVSLKGTQLKAGHYKVSWEEHSLEVTVTISKGKNVVAKAQGRFVDRPVKYRRNMVLDTENADGSRTVTEIRIAGTSRAIVFE